MLFSISFTVLLINILIMDAEITMCGFKFSVAFYCDSHLYQLFPRVRACVRRVRKRKFHGSAPACRAAGRCASSLPARLSMVAKCDHLIAVWRPDIVSPSPDKAPYCKWLWIKASATSPQRKRATSTIGCGCFRSAPLTKRRLAPDRT